MGVLGLVPFLQKTCPEVFRSLPNRLKSLSGKTVVIDGTLITQRLHFAPMPHPYRHVLGWYRIVQELRNAGVGAICVFDGKDRNIAKQAETERRRETRRVTAVRGTLEAERLKRLCRLTAHVHAWRSLNAEARESTTQNLRELVQRIDPPHIPWSPDVIANNETVDDVGDGNASIWADSGQVDAESEVYDDIEEDDLAEALKNIPNTLVRASSEPTTESSLDSPGSTAVIESKRDKGIPTAVETARSFLAQLSLEDADPARVDESYELVDELPPETTSVTKPSGPVSPEDVKSALAASYLEYRASLAQLSPLSEPSTTQAQSEDVSEARADFIMSKTQHQLTVDEGRFWEQLTDTTQADSVEAAAVALAEKSSLVSDSYERRTHPPTSETYVESMEMLHAMGVPCIECDGPYEAEALASSLVLHGMADYVASEDTDVIVYGAPLIRNLTRRDEPLVIVSGEEVCTTLELDRARFIDFALLLGTDFSQRIKNVGPQRAFKFIREYGSIERVVEHETQYPPRVAPSVYLEQVAEARAVFATLPPTPDAKLLRPSCFDEERTHDVLRRYGLGREIPASDWDYSDALAGNYFQDDPAA